MKDILLDANGDIKLNKSGDISIADSPAQAAKIRIKWFLGEWVFAPDVGLPWYEEMLIKNYNVDYIKNRLIKEIKQVDGIIDVTEMQIITDNKERKASVKFSLKTTEGYYSEEVLLLG